MNYCHITISFFSYSLVLFFIFIKKSETRKTKVFFNETGYSKIFLKEQ